MADYKWDGQCPLCNSTKPLAKLFRSRDDIRVCVVCGAAFEEKEGEFYYNSTYNTLLTDKQKQGDVNGETNS